MSARTRGINGSREVPFLMMVGLYSLHFLTKTEVGKPHSHVRHGHLFVSLRSGQLISTLTGITCPMVMSALIPEPGHSRALLRTTSYSFGPYSGRFPTKITMYSTFQKIQGNGV